MAILDVAWPLGLKFVLKIPGTMKVDDDLGQLIEAGGLAGAAVEDLPTASSFSIMSISMTISTTSWTEIKSRVTVP